MNIIIEYYILMVLGYNLPTNFLPKLGVDNKIKSKPHKSLLTFAFIPTPALYTYLFIQLV